jgi:hypothetical protein
VLNSSRRDIGFRNHKKSPESRPSQKRFLNIELAPDFQFYGSLCFSFRKSFSSITFASNSELIRIESSAFYESSLESILIPNNVEILESKCFSSCYSLSSIPFESNSQLKRIESSAFSSSSLESILIPQEC